MAMQGATSALVGQLGANSRASSSLLQLTSDVNLRRVPTTTELRAIQSQRTDAAPLSAKQTFYGYISNQPL